MSRLSLIAPQVGTDLSSVSLGPRKQKKKLKDFATKSKHDGSI